MTSRTYDRILNGIFIFQSLWFAYIAWTYTRILGKDLVREAFLSPGWLTSFFALVYLVMIMVVVWAMVRHKKEYQKIRWIVLASAVWTMCFIVLRILFQDALTESTRTQRLPELAASSLYVLSWAFILKDARVLQVRRRRFSLQSLSFSWPKLLLGLSGTLYLVCSWSQLSVLGLAFVWPIWQEYLQSPLVITVFLIVLISIFYHLPLSQQSRGVRSFDDLYLPLLYIGLLWEIFLSGAWLDYGSALGVWDLPPVITAVRTVSFFCIGAIIIAALFLRGPLIDQEAPEESQLA